MGILIRLNLVRNKEELNVKVINDDGVADSIDRMSNVLANFNVAINEKSNQKDAGISILSGRGNYSQEVNKGAVNNKENDEDNVNEHCDQLNSVSISSDENAECRNEDECDDNEDTFEEYFVVDRVLANRFNSTTKQHEFLLKLKDCRPVKNTWKSVSGVRANELPDQGGCLYVQKSSSLLHLKQKRRAANLSSSYQESQSRDSYLRPQLVDLEREELGLHVEKCDPDVVLIEEESEKSHSTNQDPSANDYFPTDESAYNTPADDHFYADTDSIQSVNDISIKCEPIFENTEDNYYRYDQDLMNFGKHPLAACSNENLDLPLQENQTLSMSDLNQHSQPNIFSCNLCGRAFTALHYLHMHEKIHTKAVVYPCSICNQVYSNAHLLSVHERDAHGVSHPRKPRGCPPGGKRTKREPSEQSPAKPFECPLCIRTFASQHLLTLHESVHNDGRLFPCNSCDRVFTYSHAWKNHQRVHSSVKSLPCSYCGKLFSMEARLRLHERKHGINMKLQKPITAVNTTKIFTDPMKKYTCQHCPKTFRLKHTLHVHMRQHTGEKPYACQLCDYRSAQRISLSCHMRKHERNWAQNTSS